MKNIHNYYICLSLCLLISTSVHGVDGDYFDKAKRVIVYTAVSPNAHMFPNAQLLRTRTLRDNSMPAAPVPDTTVRKTDGKGFIHYSSGAYTVSFNNSLGEYSGHHQIYRRNGGFTCVELNSVEAKSMFLRFQSLESLQQ